MLRQTQRTRLLKQLSLLGSNFEGEQIAAINAINRTLESSNTTWNDFIQTLDIDNVDQSAYNSGFSDGFQAGCNQKNQPNHHEMLSELKSKENVLNEWSKSFINNLHNHKAWLLTEKQERCIERIYNQFCK